MNVKKAFLIFLAIVALLYSVQAQCGISGQTTLVTNEVELNELMGCDTIYGNLTIEDPNVSYLSALSELTYVEGDLSIIGCTSLFDLDALSNLTHIGGDLIFQVVFTLQNINGISNLNFIGGDVIFDMVISISNVDGLSGLTNVNGDLLFISNHGLENINGLTNITTINGDLYFGNANNSLNDVSGLNNLTTVGGDFYFNLPNITNMPDFTGLSDVGGDFTIEGCDVLASITGFTSLSNVSETLLIQENPIMVNTDGLDSLAYVGADMMVINNPSYFSCCGLFNIITQGQIHGELTLENNAFSCNSADDIIKNCTVGIGQYDTNIFVTKRKVDTGIELIFNGVNSAKDIRVYSMMGQLVYDVQAYSNSQLLIPLRQNSIYLIDIRQNGMRKVIKTNF